MPSVLLCTPDHFDVLYAINPHMKPGSVDKALAVSQWGALKNALDAVGVKTKLVPGQPSFPDMVFCANQSLPFVRKDGSKAVLLSNMASEHRRGEVQHIADWYASQGYELVPIPQEHGFFEGMGDTVYHGDGSFLWGGYGFRTEARVHRSIRELSGLEVKPLRLVTEDFYHLDVALAVLDERTALVYKPAFDEASFALLQEDFEDLILVSSEDAYNFACNAYCPDGKHVFLQEGSLEAEEALRARGFVPVPLDTSEYIKSGGSVFCMKMHLPA